MTEELILRLGLALAIGLVVGVERGWREREAPDGHRTAGVRTYGLVGLLGGALAALGQATANPAVLPVSFVTFSAIFAWYRLRESVEENDFSVTAVVAALAVFALGALAVAGDMQAAAAGGVATVALLASRRWLHDLLRRLTWLELRSAVLLLAMAVIGLQVLPDRTVDPWGGVNPWEIWFFTVLTATISFGGYVAMRMLGPGKGVLVSGLVGAIASSMAVTAAFARRAKSGEAPRTLSGGGALAAMISIMRVTVVVALVRPALVPHIIVPNALAALIFGIAGAFLIFRSPRSADGETKLGNPFELGPLLIFAASFAVVAAASSALNQLVGSQSAVLTAGLSGIFDTDVAALTATRLAGEGLAYELAADAILLAELLNGLARLAVAIVLGPVRFWAPLAIAATAAGLAGAAAWYLV